MSKKTYTFSKNGPGNLRTIARNGQSIRTDRIDFDVHASGTVMVTQMTRYKADRRDIAHTWTTYDQEVGFDLALALAWCEENGFVVETWPTSKSWDNPKACIRGARAWRGAKWPIRTGWQIQKLRCRLEREVIAWADTAPWLREERGLENPAWNLFDLQNANLAFVG